MLPLADMRGTQLLPTPVAVRLKPHYRGSAPENLAGSKQGGAVLLRVLMYAGMGST